MGTWRDRFSKMQTALAKLGSRKDHIPPDIRQRVPLGDIQKVTFYKRDELATDLICCDVEAHGQTWFFHEEAGGWDELVAYLEQLPGFREDWYEAVVKPPFATCETVAFARP